MNRLAFAAAALAAAAACPAVRAADIDRGRALYELHCQGCHSESVHARKARVAASFTEVRSWVERWGRHLRLDWTDVEIDDVSVHVNAAYYRHPCPPAVCKAVSRGPEPGRLPAGPAQKPIASSRKAASTVPAIATP